MAKAIKTKAVCNGAYCRNVVEFVIQYGDRQGTPLCSKCQEVFSRPLILCCDLTHNTPLVVKDLSV